MFPYIRDEETPSSTSLFTLGSLRGSHLLFPSVLVHIDANSIALWSPTIRLEHSLGFRRRRSLDEIHARLYASLDSIACHTAGSSVGSSLPVPSLALSLPLQIPAHYLQSPEKINRSPLSSFVAARQCTSRSSLYVRARAQFVTCHHRLGRQVSVRSIDS